MTHYSYHLKETGKSIHGSWILLSWLTFSLTAIISLIIMIIPIVMLFRDQTLQSLLWFILIPVGMWTLNKALRLFQSFINKRHKDRSQFKVDSNELTYTIVDDASNEIKASNTILLSSIKHVVTSTYQLKNSHLYTNPFTDTSVKVDDFPVLFVVFEDAERLRQIAITFYDETSIKEWLLYFQQYDIPLYYGFLNPHIHLTNLDDMSESLLDTEVMVPFKIQKSSHWRWMAIELRLEAYSILSKAVDQQDSIEELNKTESLLHGRRLKQLQEQTLSPPKLSKLTFNKWSQAAIKTYLIICLGALTAIYLAEIGAIDYKGPLPGFGLLFISALVYFWSLRHHFRWYYMISFCLESFIVILLSAIFINEENTTPIIDEMISSLLASVILFPLLIWVPYSIIAYIRKRLTT